LNSWSELDRKVSAEINLSRKHPGYFRPVVFRLAFGVIFALFLATGFSNGWTVEANYAICRSVLPCENPFYVPGCEDCGSPLISPGGSVGTAPNWLYQDFGFLVAVILLAAFGANHSLWQRRIRTHEQH